MVGCSEQKYPNSNLNLFNPNKDLNIAEVEDDMGGVREKEIDLHVYVFHNADTTVVIQFDSDEKLINYDWSVSIPDSQDFSSCLLDLCKKYKIEIDTSRKRIHCLSNDLIFSYYFCTPDTFNYNPNKHICICLQKE